ncbi:Serine/threonine-protein kinase [Coemansia erecta]|uniref:non-specific serine/threonine protein kinase n=1 Tax=Coemansia erecta TaxID=147472 RepID=A0A9W8CSR5_9FUNG|nr:Serine/threonine-protein kinase [Coemansia erecta]
MQANDQGSTSVSPRQRASVVIGDYELGPQIGKGSFATVYRGLNKKTNTPVAIKSVVRSSLTRRLLENLETEINILRTVRHPSIVELIDCLKSRNHIHLVMEYCALGDLASYLRKRKEHPALRNEYGGLNMDIVRQFVSQLGDAMRFLRSRDVIHRDIKTQNILLVPPPNYTLGDSEARGEIPKIKVADFGFARNLPSSALAETLCGSPLYMAPEILHYEPYDAKADLWSIGAVIYEMMTGKQPFHASNHVELARIIERTNDNIVFPDERQAKGALDAAETDKPRIPVLDPVLKDLVRGLLKMKPADRMSFEDFFAHPALRYPRDDVQPQDGSREYSDYHGLSAAMGELTIAAGTSDDAVEPGRNQAANHPYYQNQQQQQQQQQPRYPPNSRATTMPYQNMTSSPPLSAQQHHYHQQRHQHQRSSSHSYDRHSYQSHQRKSSLAEEEQALAEREYVVIEKRAVEMNYLADEMESSPRTPISFYPPRVGAIHQAPGVARQMTALARAIHNAVSSQYNISTEAANGPLNSRLASNTAAAAAAGGVSDAVGRRNSGPAVFNPLDQDLADTFESRHSQGTQQEEPTIRRMEGLAYMAFAMSVLADMKWRLLPPSVTGASSAKNKSKGIKTDPLVDSDGGYLNPSDVTIEEAFVLYLRALSLLHCAMREASRYWAGLHDSESHSLSTNNTANSNTSVTVSTAFNGAVQWVRAKFNECLDRAEALKQLANGHELDNVAQVSIVQVLYEQALALGKVAAMRELKWIDPLDCDRAYQLAIWMLSAILETTDTASAAARSNSSHSAHGALEGLAGDLEDEEEMGIEDRTIVEQFIASIVKRREKLQRRLMQLENLE